MKNYLIFDSLPKLVKSGQFLPVDAAINSKFSGTDTEKLFLENLKTMPANWAYRTAPVEYTYNKHYYRTQEFNKIDWAESIVIFGCSNVFGVGVDDADTISSQLSRIIDRPVINMGVGGSSITYSLHNSVILASARPMPFGVVNLWTDHSRTVYYHRNRLSSYGSWNLREDNYMAEWSKSESHSMTHAIIASMTSKQLWKDTRYYEASFFKDTAKCLNCDMLSIVDVARDIGHPGPNTLKFTAEKIAENLKL